MRTEELINALAADHERRSTPFGRAVMLGLVCGTLLAGAVFFLWIGVRPDIAAALETVRFPFKFVITLSLAAAAAGIVARLGRPGAPIGVRGWALLVAPVLLALGVAVELATVPASSWGTRLVGTKAPFCLTLIPLMSIGPLACLLLVLRHGAPTRPGLAGAAAGLLAGAIAATFYAANCTDDSPLFVAVWYPLAIMIVCLSGAAAGSRYLRW